MKTILVVDGNSIINRAFYGLRLLQTAEGIYTNAIYGMISMISRQMDSLHPDYVAVAFDVKAPTFRHKMYDEYKAGRHATPPELLAQFPYAKACLSAMGLHTLELPGWEADDIQGTVASMAHGEEDTHAYILTGDRDLLQLIDENITVLLAGNKDTIAMDEQAFFDKYGISPKQFVDTKALMGDSSDHIPGVPGVGEKTALKLIAQCGSLDKIYHLLDHPELREGELKKVFTDGLCKKLTEGRESAYLSQDLARIRTDAPIGKALGDLHFNGHENDALYRLFQQLEFRGFITKYKLTPPSTPEKEDIEMQWEDFSSDDALDTPSQEQAEASPAPAPKKIVLPSPLEIPVSNVDNAHALPENLPSTLAMALEGEICHLYAPEIGEWIVNLNSSAIPPLFSDKFTLICYDSKALWHKIKSMGHTLYSVPCDVMLSGYLWRGGDGHVSLDSLCFSLFKCEAEAYHATPAALLYYLHEALLSHLHEEGMYTLASEIEWPLALVLAEMEYNGFLLDREGCIAYGKELEAEAMRLTECVYKEAGHPFNLNSPKQLGAVLFEELGLPVQKKTKSGYSTDAETLESLRGEHPIISYILEYRQVSKLLSTYAVGLVAAADEHGRIHTDFKQALTATGRLSSAEPNLQNIPVRTKAGERMRAYFITEPDWVLIDADYSQIELRLLAHISQDKQMISAFLSGHDIHAETAATVFGVAREEVTSELRKRAKAVNFGIVYGIGPYSLSIDLQVPQKQAKAYIESYLASYPNIRAYLDETVEKATKNGYTTTLFGRRRYIPQLKSSKAMERAFGKRLAMNSPIQGTAADIMKLAMLKVHRRLKAELPMARLVMQVHDELIVEVPKAYADRAKQLLQEEMEGAVSLALPLTAEASHGQTWLEAKS